MLSGDVAGFEVAFIEAFAELGDVSKSKNRPDLLVVNHKQKLCVLGEIKVSYKENED